MEKDVQSMEASDHQALWAALRDTDSKLAVQKAHCNRLEKAQAA